MQTVTQMEGGVLVPKGKDVDYFFSIKKEEDGSISCLKVSRVICPVHGEKFFEKVEEGDNKCPECGRESLPASRLFCEDCKMFSDLIVLGSPEEAYICPRCRKNLLK